MITEFFILLFSCEVRYDLSVDIKMLSEDTATMMKQKGQMHKIR